MSLHYQEADPIILGSGELYLGTVENPETADEATIEAALKNVGAIESGATLNYKPTIKKIKSANRGTLMSFITDDEVTFDCGIITWVIDNISRLAPATVTTDAETGTKTMKIKSMGSLPVNYLRFIHQKKSEPGTITVNFLKAQNTNGFKFTFDNENPLSVAYEFTALADNNGNLVEIIETFE